MIDSMALLLVVVEVLSVDAKFKTKNQEGGIGRIHPSRMIFTMISEAWTNEDPRFCQNWIVTCQCDGFCWDWIDVGLVKANLSEPDTIQWIVDSG